MLTVHQHIIQAPLLYKIEITLHHLQIVTGLHLRKIFNIHRLITSPSADTLCRHANSTHGGNKNSLQELEKKATATWRHWSVELFRLHSMIPVTDIRGEGRMNGTLTPKTATLLTTLAFSGEVKVLYAFEK